MAYQRAAVQHKRAAMRTFLLAVLVLWPTLIWAADDPLAYEWQQRPGAALPQSVPLRDEAGRQTTLSQSFTGPPVILDLGYYHCPTLCGVVRRDLIDALTTSGLVRGRDYRLVALSIDANETPQDAADAKAADLHQAGLQDGPDWRYLTGPAESIAGVAEAVGFRSRFDAALKQFLHPAGLVVLTSDGRVSSYLLGVGYSGGDLRAAVLRAGAGGVSQASLPVLLLCFHFDPATGHYTLVIEKVLRLMAVLTVLTLGSLLVVLHRSARRS